jgi:hypothetical protein
LTLEAAAIALTLGLWLLLSVANQYRPFALRIGRYDHFSLLPRWTFFAPNPGMHDVHLLYRECAADLDVSTPEGLNGASAKLSPWREMADLCPGHNVLFVWNPQRRVTKTILDIVAVLNRVRQLTDDQNAQITVEYFLLLHLVMRGAGDSTQRQFAVVRTHGFGPERQSEVVFLSAFHPAGQA